MDFQRIAEVALEAVGAASALAAGIRQVLPALREYANKTATNADNAAVEAAAIGLSMLTMLIEFVQSIANKAALNPPKHVVVVEQEQVEP